MKSVTMKNTLITLAFLGGLSLLGCDSGGDKAAGADAAAKPGSCQEGGPTGSTCSDYTAEGAKDGKSFCEKTGGGKNVWSDDKCPTENKIGTCERSDGQSQHYYSTGEDAMDADGAKEMCVELSNGKWVEASAAAPAEPAPAADGAAPAGDAAAPAAEGAAPAGDAPAEAPKAEAG
ncbi:hypothetical protein PPSIR1_06221 [Plesiocystis pacifica SIR-1]|uniref:Uncharacterized protein n=2 Tax=Plesiocystis pacifica TaxID=191768 RepID=A6G6W9_9BACT|nr:hypothetical protein PPSIR1_06221 [Plesiocystis pacifica SIR-1]